MGSLPWIAGFLETFPGLFLLVGLFTRPVAFILSGEMAFAYFMGHAPHGLLYHLWSGLRRGPAVESRMNLSEAACKSL